MVSTNLTNVSAEGLSGKAAFISGKEGAMVAPAITVIILMNRIVIFARSGFFRKVNLLGLATIN